jgi:hypothetical protein
MDAIRTLVVHAGGIGDFLLACPSILLLAEEGPVELLGRKERLALAAGRVDAVHDMNRVDFESVFIAPSTRLKEFLERYNRVVVWMRDDGTISRAIHRCGVSDVRVFPGLPPAHWTEHASLYYLQCLGYEKAPTLRLKFEPADKPHDVVIHPGSGSRRKNWPLEQYQTIAREFEAAGREVTWSFGPAEEDMNVGKAAREIRCDQPASIACELAASNLYIGNDSGITHLAAAVGCPTAAVFGPTDPKVWAPFGKHVTVVQGHPWPDWELVLTAAKSI